MPPQTNSSTTTCPVCHGSGQVNVGGKSMICPACKGQGVTPAGFPVPFHYPINLTVTQPVTGSQPSQSVPSAPTFTGLSGTNPVILRMGNEAAFEWIYALATATSPNVSGDASRFVQVMLQDMSSQFNFSSSAVGLGLFAGSGQLPFAQLEPYTFGKQTQLSLTGYPVNYTNNVLVFGIGNGAATTFSTTLNAPVLPGSLTVTDPTGSITGTDNGNGEITGTGISGTINYATGALSVTYAAAPAAGANPTATYTIGCSLINVQFSIWGQLLVPQTGTGANQIQPLAS